MLRAALWLFANSYNKFKATKLKSRLLFSDCGRDFDFSHVQLV